MKRFILILLAVLLIGNAGLEATVVRATSLSASQAEIVPETEQEATQLPQVEDLSDETQEMPEQTGEKTQPEETQPEETQPEETQPEETQPEETQPEETQPEEIHPDDWGQFIFGDLVHEETEVLRERSGSVDMRFIYCTDTPQWSACYAYWSGSDQECEQFPGVEMTMGQDGRWSTAIPRDAAYVTFGNGSDSLDAVPLSEENVYSVEEESWSVSEASLETVWLQCKPPKNWETCYVYWQGGDAPGVQWPGAQMYLSEYGVYIYNVPADAETVIFNMGTESMKSPKLELPSNERTMYLLEYNVWVLGNCLRGPFYVMGDAALCGADWIVNDFQSLMTSQKTCIWEKTYYSVKPGYYSLTVSNGSYSNLWSDENPGKDGGVYTLIVDVTSDVCITFNALQETVSVSVTESEVIEETGKLYCRAPEEWQVCYVYWWGGTQACDFWPGYPLAMNAEGLWEADVPLDATELVFHNNDGGQTPDLARPGEPMVFDVKDDRWYANEDYTGPVTSNGYYVAGSSGLCGSEWMEKDPNNKMIDQGDGTWIKEFYDVQPGTYELKITNGTWEVSFGGGQWGLEPYVLTITTVTNVTVLFDAESGVVEYRIGTEQSSPAGPDMGETDVGPNSSQGSNGDTGSDGNSGTTAEADKEVTGKPSEYYVVGNASWMGYWDVASDAGRMLEVSPGVYKKIFENVPPGTYELKIIKDQKWDQSWGNNGQNYIFTVPQTCTITVSFTLNGQDGQITVWGSGIGDPDCSGDDEPEQEDVFRVVGNAAWMGNGNPASDQGLMQLDVKGVYGKTFSNVSSGVYELRITRNGTFDESWGIAGKGSKSYEFELSQDADLVTVEFEYDTGSVRVIVKGKQVYRGSNGGMYYKEAVDRQSTMIKFGGYLTRQLVLIPSDVFPPGTPEDSGTSGDAGSSENSGNSNDYNDPENSYSSSESENSGENVPGSPGPEADANSGPIQGTDSAEGSQNSADSSEDVKDSTTETEVEPDYLANAPMTEMTMVWFGLVAVVIYVVLVSVKRNRKVVAQTPVGQVEGTNAPLSLYETEKMVAENPVTPSSELDQRIFETIRNMKK